MTAKNSALVEYISTELKQGFRAEDIKARLLSTGYSNEEIDNAFSAYIAFKHKKRIIFFSLIVVGCILTGAVLTYLFIDSLWLVKSFPECEGKTDFKLQYCQDTQYYMTAVKTRKPSLCNKIIDESRQEDCFIEFGILEGSRKDHYERVVNLALSSGSPQPCRQFDRESLRLQCSDKFYLEKAKKENNEALCQFLQFEENRRDCP